MTYGVKAIHIISIGNADQRLYEEIILRVETNSYDEAYSKAAAHLMNSVLDHTNPEGQQVRAFNAHPILESQDGLFRQGAVADLAQYSKLTDTIYQITNQ